MLGYDELVYRPGSNTQEGILFVARKKSADFKNERNPC